MQLANPGKRIGAYIIDGLIISTILSIIAIASIDWEELFDLLKYISNNSQYISPAEIEYLLIDIMVRPIFFSTIGAIVLTILYYNVLPLIWKHQTVGRAATKILVLDENGNKPKFSKLFIREAFGQGLIASLISIIGMFGTTDIYFKVSSTASDLLSLFLIIGFIIMCGERKTTLYDLISKTRVVLKDSLNVSEPDMYDTLDA